MVKRNPLNCLITLCHNADSLLCWILISPFSLSSCQVLVLGNKRDLPNALDEKQLIEKM